MKSFSQLSTEELSSIYWVAWFIVAWWCLYIPAELHKGTQSAQDSAPKTKRLSLQAAVNY
jgi:hypothetical protein